MPWAGMSDERLDRAWGGRENRKAASLAIAADMAAQLRYYRSARSWLVRHGWREPLPNPGWANLNEVERRAGLPLT